jgi:predicted PurR-regulated permease PerM
MQPIRANHSPQEKLYQLQCEAAWTNRFAEKQMNLPNTPASGDSDAAVDGKELARFQKRLNLLAASLIVVVALIYLLQTFATVLQQLLVAVFIVYLIMPPYYWLVRRGFSPLLSRILILAGIVLAVTVLGVVVGSSVADLEAKLPNYREALNHVINKTAIAIPGLGDKARGWWESNTPHTLDQVTRFVRVGLQALSNFLSQFFVVVIYVLFILAERASVRQRAMHAFRPEQIRRIQEFVERVNASITQYLVVKTLMSLLGGLATWVVLIAFGVDYAGLWGLIAFLFNYIPYLGSFVAIVLPLLLSLVQFEDPLRSVAILALLLLPQMAIAYMIEPRLTGKALDLSPFVIILALAFWGSLWGIVGMILAVPLVVTTKTILDQILVTRPLGRMLSNA